jgi:hypothetical protein
MPSMIICYMVTDIVGFLIIRLIPALATFFLAALSNRRSALCAAIQTDDLLISA